jgi:hypothetical protein
VSEVTLLIMTGVHDTSQLEMMMAGARQAITKDIIERAQTVAGISQTLLSTNAPALADWAQSRGVTVEMDPPGSTFHFGQRLRELASKYGAERLFYMGGGSGALLTAREMAEILAEEAGLPNHSLDRKASTQLDVDTPTDLMTLAPHPGVGGHTRAFLDGLDLDTSHVQEAMRPFVDRDAEVVVGGRVSAAVWEYLERETACRVRVFAEERGMRASGRQARGQARSLMGYHYQQVGPQRFFRTLSELGQAIFLDSRVIFAHLGIWPPASDRFHSYLRRPEHIANAMVRKFTEAAISSPVPVVLGGHSLVSGGLYALVEAAWACCGVDIPRYVNHTVWGHGKVLGQQ